MKGHGPSELDDNAEAKVANSLSVYSNHIFTGILIIIGLLVLRQDDRMQVQASLGIRRNDSFTSLRKRGFELWTESPTDFSAFFQEHSPTDSSSRGSDKGARYY